MADTTNIHRRSVLKAGAAARYGHTNDSSRKLAAEGVEALKEVSGSVDQVLGTLAGGVAQGRARRPSAPHPFSG